MTITKVTDTQPLTGTREFVAPRSILTPSFPIHELARPNRGIIYHIMTRSLVWMGLFVGSTIGGLVPELWGAGLFSMSTIVFSFIGGISGIWLGYKIGQSF